MLSLCAKQDTQRNVSDTKYVRMTFTVQTKRKQKKRSHNHISRTDLASKKWERIAKAKTLRKPAQSVQSNDHTNTQSEWDTQMHGLKCTETERVQSVRAYPMLRLWAKQDTQMNEPDTSMYEWTSQCKQSASKKREVTITYHAQILQARNERELQRRKLLESQHRVCKAMITRTHKVNETRKGMTQNAQRQNMFKAWER